MSVPTSAFRYLLLAGFLTTAALTAQAQQTAPGTTAAQLKDGAFRRNGKVFRLQAGQTTPLSAPLRFTNGLTLRPDGIMVSKNGTRQLLENGKAVNMQGDVVIYRDDMMTPEAIARHDEQATGSAGTTTVAIPVATNLAAIATQLQNTAQRLDQLRQLSQLLDQRATAAAAGSTPAPELETRIQQLSQQLQP
ncbi:DUF6799 domain-containing protein [Hymenobacter metallilatus]|uniref:DUF6799 domain-containing protein n=1 Tax=Hymenobacter metallilatus TaxID=2493666 RepID=A0A3R9NE44_9BACT|nr:DUF6799 domain-containing protein [Hymenobacter metallilatus]RSK30095.1 hypothetical protein EI290_14655 [Hymenobacter metallilatus]